MFFAQGPRALHLFKATGLGYDRIGCSYRNNSMISDKPCLEEALLSSSYSCVRDMLTRHGVLWACPQLFSLSRYPLSHPHDDSCPRVPSHPPPFTGPRYMIHPLFPSLSHSLVVIATTHHLSSLEWQRVLISHFWLGGRVKQGVHLGCCCCFN